MKRQITLFAGSFFSSLIFIGALCGFALVDARVELYMPGRFGSMFELTAIDSSGLYFDFMGQSYQIDGELHEKARKLAQKYGAFIPFELKLLYYGTQKAATFVEEHGGSLKLHTLRDDVQQEP